MLNPKHAPPADLLIIDTSYVAYKSYCITSQLEKKLTAPDGFPTDTIHGFIGAVKGAAKACRAKTVVIAMDDGDGGRRKVYPEYKAHRTEFPQNFAVQMEAMPELLTALGWCVIDVPGFEADDVIASVCQARPDDFKVLWSVDKDLHSLVNDKLVIYNRVKGKAELLEASDIKSKWQVDPHQIPEVLAILGDMVDNIPGVSGFGKKTATELVQLYGTVEGMLTAVEQENPSPAWPLYAHQLEKLREQVVQCRLSRQLVTLQTPELPPDCLVSKPNEDEVIRLANRYGMKTLLPKVAAQAEPELFNL